MASDPKLPIPFTPVPVRPRHDGWTTERQIAFVEKLADCGSVSAACKHVGMSRESVRQLRRRPCGRSFRNACDAALDFAYTEVEEAAMERAINGVARPLFYRGEQVGECRDYDERLTMFLLRFRRRHRFGPEADFLPRPTAGIPGIDPDERRVFDPEGALDSQLDALDFASDEPRGDEGEDGEGGEGAAEEGEALEGKAGDGGGRDDENAQGETGDGQSRVGETEAPGLPKSPHQ